MMDLLNSDWLLRMLEKSGSTPQARMLALFDILDDWLNAPRLVHQPSDALPNNYPKLLTYMTHQASLIQAEEPQLLANQLCLMAIFAGQQKALTPHCNSLLHAKTAAEALIFAQKKPAKIALQATKYAAAGLAGLVGLCVVAVSAYIWHSTPAPIQSTASTSAIARPAPEPLLVASPQETAALYAQIERMRKGTCQLPEALQMPDSYKKVYFENIVLGQISTNRDEQRLVWQLLDKVRCNYTPMLMANSKN